MDNNKHIPLRTIESTPVLGNLDRICDMEEGRLSGKVFWDPAIYEQELEKREAEANAQAASKTDIGWGHQIRSYVLQPYQLVKDLRTGVTSTAPGDVLDGALDPFMAAALSQKVTGEKVEVEDID